MRGSVVWSESSRKLGGHTSYRNNVGDSHVSIRGLFNQPNEESNYEVADLEAPLLTNDMYRLSE